MNRRRSNFSFVLAFGCISLAGAAMCCSRTASAQREESWTAEISKSASSDAASATIEVERASITVAQRLRVRVRIEAAPGVSVSIPPAPVTLGDFEVVEATDSPARLSRSGRTILVRDFLLEPFLEGAYTIPPLEIPYHRSGNQSQPRGDPNGMAVSPDGLLRTEEVTITVTSVLPKDAPETELTAQALGLPRSIVDPPARPRHAIWVIGLSAGVAIIAAFGAMNVLRSRRRREQTVNECARGLERVRALGSQPPAVAIDELPLLLRRCLAERCDPRAIGMTTEEIAAAIPSWPGLDAHEAGALRETLGFCDSVRYGGGLHEDGRVRAALVDAEKVIRWLGRAPIIPHPGMTA